jgi:hypothetical protein
MVEHESQKRRPTTAMTSPFFVPLAHNSAPLQTAKTLHHSTKGPAAKIESLREAPTIQTSRKPDQDRCRKPAACAVMSCFLRPPATGIRVQLLVTER